MEFKYKEAMVFYEEEEYDKALLIFEDLIPVFAGDKRLELLQFYYAYCHYHEQMYLSSAHYFMSFYNVYRRSEHAEEAFFLSVQSQYTSIPYFTLDQSNTLKTIQAFQDFIETYPKSKYFDRCNEAMEALHKNLEKKAFAIAYQYEKLSQNESAVLSFRNFQLDFPGSELQDEASYRIFLNQYQVAQLSIEAKKEERVNKAIEYYYNFIETFPNSPFLSKAQNYFLKSRNLLVKANK